MIGVDLLTLGLLVVVLGFFFFMYLMVRRTLMGFKEGVQSGRKK